MSHAEFRNAEMDLGANSPPRGYFDASQAYEPVQFYETTYNPHYDNLATPDPTPKAAPGGPWQTEAEWTEAPAASKPPSNLSWFDRLNKGWTPEIFSQACSVLFLLALIILLSRLEGRPLSTWTIAVAPNAVIAILSIASKASLIYALGQAISQLKWLHLLKKPENLQDLQRYDDASRGPLGAIRMFWTVRSASLVAYLGSLTILLALAFEPFSQQLLHFDERVITYPYQRSSVPLSTVYDYDAQGVDGVSSVIVGPRDNPMRAAVVNGIYDVVKDPPFTCPGATCSYPTFTTMGVCSECEDITSTIVKTQVNVSFGQLWSYRTPNNLTIEASAVQDAHSGFSHTLANATAVALNSAFAGLGMPVRTGIIRFPDDQSTGRSNIGNWMDTMQAYECKLSFCGRRFVGWNITNGTITPGEDQIINLNNSDVPSHSAPWYRVLAPLNASDSLGIRNGNNSFQINYLDGENMAEILSSVFNVVGEIPENQQIGPLALYSSPDIMATVDNVAKGMSYRMMSGPNSTTTYGDVYETQTYMRVRWPWITLLVALVVASSFCLIAVIVMTRQAQQLIWKSSLTPLLLPDVSYLLTSARERPFENYTELRTRSRTIASHLTK
ncbi:hypothetical protein F5Y09DRAFT_293549 [Xylaria sp. FL1042]|nr:hypothetical protein F5Y09DRAFT_293181 [Xylaria sp. FL1042]KAI0435427.1 hypothetical protein F5Y09DRAFT_293549 [Xylaria sp. FL1042]